MVFVGEDRSLGLEHRLADYVLGGDQLDLVVLARRLVGDRRCYVRVRVGQ